MNKKLLNIDCRTCGRLRKYTKKGKLYCPNCQKQYAIKNAEKIRLNSIEYRKNNMDRIKEARLKYRDIHLEKTRLWKKNNVEHSLRYRKWYQQEKIPPDYAVWVGMKSRCYNKKHPKYNIYGGRGIVVCDRWRESFQNFIEDMGPRPEPKFKYSLDRIDVNGNYEPSNCRWATTKEQCDNTRRNIAYRVSISDNSPVYYKGEGMTLLHFHKLTGVALIVLKYRWSQYPTDSEWLLHADNDNRYWEYRCHNYNVRELSLISGIYPQKLRGRLYSNWDVERAMIP